MIKTLFRNFIAALAVGGSVFAPMPLYADSSKESLVKAAFIYNFVKFVEWPASKSINQQSSIDICVLGDSTLGSTAQVFKAASTAKLTLALVVEPDAKKIASHCHIVFISQSETIHFNEIIEMLKGQPVLTVSDMDNFAQQGGMIGFVTSENKIKVEVNTKAVIKAGLRVDAQLLEIAKRVIDR